MIHHKKSHLIILILLFFAKVAGAQDSVDRLSVRYGELERKGLVRLHKNHHDELLKVRDDAMERKDLKLANKADARMKQLMALILKLDSNVSLFDNAKQGFPASDDYKMSFHNGKRGTEHGKEILCRFERRPVRRFTEGTLILTLHSSPKRMSDTDHEIFVLNGSGGEVIGKTKGMGTGESKKIPLKLNAAGSHEISIVVRGGNALHLKQFSGSEFPEVYLSIRE